MAGKCGFIYSLIITVESSQIKVIGKWTRLGTMVDGHAHAGTVHYVILCSCRCNAIDPGCSYLSLSGKTFGPEICEQLCPAVAPFQRRTFHFPELTVYHVYLYSVR
jgi:hypothetical protein